VESDIARTREAIDTPPACGYFAVVRCARPIWHAILDPSKLGSFSSAGRRPASRGVVAPVATSGEGMRRAWLFECFFRGKIALNAIERCYSFSLRQLQSCVAIDDDAVVSNHDWIAEGEVATF
jgi:hypothetical protein